MYHIKNNDPASRASVTDSERARLIELFADQITAAVDEAIREIDALSHSFFDTARHASTLLGVVGDQSPDLSAERDSLLADSEALQQAVQNVTTRLQFADRLNQRLSNVSKNLSGLAELMQSTDLPITDIKWSAFLNETRATFTMKQERQMFDAMFGAPTAAIGVDPATDTSQNLTIFDGDSRDGA